MEIKYKSIQNIIRVGENLLNKKIQNLILQNKLGSEVIEIQKVSGGLSHKMYKVKTDKAVFAVKELNPAIMCRKDAYENFVFSEKVARLAKQNGLNAVCALQFNGNVVLKIENGFFMVFNWVNGKTLKPEQVDLKHCETIGQTLAKIHNIDFLGMLDMKPQSIGSEIFDLEKYIPLALEQNKPYTQNLQDNISLLKKLNTLAVKAIKNLNTSLTISHTDLDCKNVMWQNYTPFIIDWEASGYINPTLELVQVAWYWAGGDIEKLDLKKFDLVIKSYVKDYKGKFCANYSDLVYANLAPKFAWLEYNLKRSLNEIEFESLEIAYGEISKTLREINYCVDQFESIETILKSNF